MDAPDEHEDLSKIEWGAGLSRLVDSQLPNVIFFCFGWTALGLPSYIWTKPYPTGMAQHEVLPYALGTVFAVVVLLSFARLCALARAGERSLPSERARLIQRTNTDADPGPVLRDSSCLGLLGLKVQPDVRGAMRTVTSVSLFASASGFVSAGWMMGLTTNCAYDLGNDLTKWHQCYEVGRGFTGSREITHAYDFKATLPVVYFFCLLVSFACSVFSSLLWFAMWKVARQMLRPTKQSAREDDGTRELPQTAMFCLACSVGIIAGVGAKVFRVMISVIHNFLFLLEFDINYNATQHTPKYCDTDNADVTPDSWQCYVPQWFIIFVPVLGGWVVAFLVLNWAPEAKGHGVPEVMDAIHYKQGIIRPSVAAVKILASSFSIGSGGSVGREGPIIQIGSTFGSMVGVYSGCSIAQRVTLIACGAAGGIAATFNTPIGGVTFAMELMLPAANSRTLMPLGIAAVTATYIGRIMIGDSPAFDIPQVRTARIENVGECQSCMVFLNYGLCVDAA